MWFLISPSGSTPGANARELRFPRSDPLGRVFLYSRSVRARVEVMVMLMREGITMMRRDREWELKTELDLSEKEFLEVQN